jgi:hypothetical protein
VLLAAARLVQAARFGVHTLLILVRSRPTVRDAATVK